MWTPQRDLCSTVLPRQSCAVYHPPIHRVKSVWRLTYASIWEASSEKLQSESCCPLKIKNRQTQYANNSVTSLERSMYILVRSKGWNQNKRRQAAPCESAISLTCVMQVMSVIRADTYTNELRNTKDRQSKTISESNMIWNQTFKILRKCQNQFDCPICFLSKTKSQR